ncbi:WD domain, G-beta repeat [compost metagenome]
MFRSKVVLNGHAGPIYAASWDGSFLYSSSGDKYVTRWDLTTNLQDSSFTVKLEHAAYALEAKSSFCFIGCTDGTLLGIDTRTKTVLWEHNFFGNAWFSLCIDLDKNWLIGGDSEGNLLILELESGKRVLHLPLAAGKIRTIVRKDNLCFVSTQLIGILVFSCDTWNEIASWEPNELGSNVVFVDEASGRIITAGRDAHIVISSLEYQLIKRIPAHYQTIYKLIMLGNQFVTASLDKTIKVWNEDFSKVEQRIEFKQGGHNRSVNGIVFIDELSFASYSDDKKLIIWQKESPIYWSDN